MTLNAVDLSGKSVGQIVCEAQSAGSHRAVWPAEGLPAGTYLLRLQAGDSRMAQKVMLLK